MTANILEGRQLAAKIRKQVADRVRAISEKLHRKPCLAVILVGEDYASTLYTSIKHGACTEVGISSIDLKFPSSITQKELEKVILDLNIDPNVDGILVQLPLPPHIDKSKILSIISKDKDVDGLTPFSAGAFLNDIDWFVPSTALAVSRLIEKTGLDLRGKVAVVVGNSIEVGRPIALFLMKKNMTVLSCNAATADLKYYCSHAELLVSATGVPKLIHADMVKKGAVVIDVGVSREGKNVVGDVDYAAVLQQAGWITPVPGGVGPVTVACLLENTVLSAERKAEAKN